MQLAARKAHAKVLYICRSAHDGALRLVSGYVRRLAVRVFTADSSGYVTRCVRKVVRAYGDGKLQRELTHELGESLSSAVYDYTVPVAAALKPQLRGHVMPGEHDQVALVGARYQRVVNARQLAAEAHCKATRGLADRTIKAVREVEAQVEMVGQVVSIPVGERPSGEEQAFQPSLGRIRRRDYTVVRGADVAVRRIRGALRAYVATLVGVQPGAGGVLSRGSGDYADARSIPNGAEILHAWQGLARRAYHRRDAYAHGAETGELREFNRKTQFPLRCLGGNIHSVTHISPPRRAYSSRNVPALPLSPRGRTPCTRRRTDCTWARSGSPASG